jgi:hypothetical protein
MKRFVALFVMSLGLVGCTGLSSLDRHNCGQGVCIEVRAIEPIRFGEPVSVTILVTTEKDIANLGVSLQYAVDVTLEESQVWESDVTDKAIWAGGASWKSVAKASQPLRFTRKIRFPPREGVFDVIAYASTPASGPIAQDSIRIDVTSTGGKVYLSGTPLPLGTPGKPILAVTITPGPSPTRDPKYSPSSTPQLKPTGIAIPTPIQKSYP